VSGRHISTIRLYSASYTGNNRTEDELQIQTIQKLNTTKQHKTEQTKTTLIQSPSTTLGQEMRWAYSTMFPARDHDCMQMILVLVHQQMSL